jgi:L-seryl-tRNA(Ser) seleniumtransferase
MNKLTVARAPVSEWLAQLPSVDKVLALECCQAWLTQYGRDEVLRVIRSTLALIRQECLAQKRTTQPDLEAVLAEIRQTLETRATPNLRRVINLTGTVLHTNLGRAVMPPEVIDAMASAAAEPCALEYDLGEGKRGDRDELVEELLCELTGQ